MAIQQNQQRLAYRQPGQPKTIVHVGEVEIGGREQVVIAGPCAIESEDQLLEAAVCVRNSGARLLRGGAFKPRTSPYSFQGFGKEGLLLLEAVGREVRLPIVTEVLDTRDVELIAAHADMLQVGARNMQNFSLLREVGKTQKPVLLKRGLCATLEEWLYAAEYILAEGNTQVVLCERGIRTFEPSTRNTLDLGTAALVNQLSHLPVIADPSHATGRAELIEPLGLASLAANMDGLMIEVHPDPSQALCDGTQSLLPDQFNAFMHQARRVSTAVGRSIQT